MNGPCLRVGKEFLGLVDYKGSGLVVKLPKQRVAEIIASGKGQSFAPAGRVFSEWLSVPKVNRRHWLGLLQLKRLKKKRGVLGRGWEENTTSDVSSRYDGASAGVRRRR